MFGTTATAGGVRVGDERWWRRRPRNSREEKKVASPCGGDGDAAGGVREPCGRGEDKGRYGREKRRGEEKERERDLVATDGS